MQVFDIVPPLNQTQIPPQPIVLALGFFDGVHCGHRAVIEAAKKEAEKRGLQLAVMTFDVHPAVIYQKRSADSVRYLSTRARKDALMAALGVDLLYVIHFTPEFARLGPQAFVDGYLVGLNAAVVVAGFDYTYGKRDVATMARLPEYAKNRFKIVTVPPATTADGDKISSTRIRHALDDGNIDLANRLLGYHYQTTGVVVHGEARGRTLGYPTANIETPPAERLPGIGIYTVRVRVQGQWIGGMASIGRNVTFGEDRAVTVEINLFDFDADIYGEHVVVEWLHYQRGEVKFSGADALIEQLGQDRIDALAFLAKEAD